MLQEPSSPRDDSQVTVLESHNTRPKGKEHHFLWHSYLKFCCAFLINTNFSLWCSVFCPACLCLKNPCSPVRSHAHSHCPALPSPPPMSLGILLLSPSRECVIPLPSSCSTLVKSYHFTHSPSNMLSPSGRCPGSPFHLWVLPSLVWTFPLFLVVLLCILTCAFVSFLPLDCSDDTVCYTEWVLNNYRIDLI